MWFHLITKLTGRGLQQDQLVWEWVTREAGEGTCYRGSPAHCGLVTRAEPWCAAGMPSYDRLFSTALMLGDAHFRWLILWGECPGSKQGCCHEESHNAEHPPCPSPAQLIFSYKLHEAGNIKGLQFIEKETETQRGYRKPVGAEATFYPSGLDPKGCPLYFCRRGVSGYWTECSQTLEAVITVTVSSLPGTMHSSPPLIPRSVSNASFQYMCLPALATVLFWCESVLLVFQRT